MHDNITMELEESLWVQIETESRGKIVLGNIYRSPNSSEANNTCLNKLFCSIGERKSVNLIIVGDFNFPEIDWVNEVCLENVNHVAYKFMEAVRDSFLYQHCIEPTRFRYGQTANVLDLVFSSEQDLINEVQTGPPLGKSDHCSLLVEVNATAPVQKKNRPRFNYYKADYDKIRQALNINWEELLRGKPVGECWAIFAKKLTEVRNRFVPCKTGSSRSRKPIWMDNATLKKVKTKRKRWMSFLETKTGEKYLEFAKARNQARWATRKAKKAFEKQVARDAKSNPKSFWAYVKSQLKNKSTIPDLDKADGSRTQTEAEKAEALNQQFKKVFTVEDTTHIPVPMPRNFEELLTDLRVDTADVREKLKVLKTNKASGPDEIHPKLLSEAKEELAVPLAIIYNQSLDAGELPADWKIAHISPIFKKGSRHLPSNYRPVSLTSVVCKMLESIIRDKVISHMDRNNLFCKDQHGFLSGRSTVTQLLESLEEWTALLEDSEGVDVLYCDFQKAFDSVPHQRLLAKVSSYGIEGTLLKWIESFLVHRQQCVVLNDTKSSWVEVTSGIPQGSVLGPLLFVIFINDIAEVVSCGIKIYADDTKIYSPIDSEADCLNLQQNIDNLLEWSHQWQLIFHPEKCHILHLGKKQDLEHRYSMEGVPLDTTEVEKDLGVHVDSELNFRTHCLKIAATANKLVGICHRSFTYMDCGVFLYLFKGIIRPRLEYASSVWSPRYARDIDTIEAVQRRATKLVPGLYDLSYEERLRKLDLPTLVFRRLRGDVIQVYKYLHGEYKVDCKDMLPLKHSTRTRGHSLCLEKQRHEKGAAGSVRSHFFSQRVVNEWNQLPEDVVSAQTLNAFKSRLDKHWRNHPLRFDYKAKDDVY